MNKKKHEDDTAKKVSKKSKEGNHVKQQTFHQKDRKPGAAAHNSEWNKPSERIYLPCSHYITSYQANKQAWDGKYTTIVCIKCRKEYPASVLEQENVADSYDSGKPSFNENSNGQYSETCRNSNERSSQHYKEKAHKSFNSGQGLMGHFHQQPRVSQWCEDFKKPAHTSDVKSNINVKRNENSNVHNENGGQQHINSKHSQHSCNDKKNSSDNPSKSDSYDSGKPSFNENSNGQYSETCRNSNKWSSQRYKEKAQKSFNSGQGLMGNFHQQPRVSPWCEGFEKPTHTSDVKSNFNVKRNENSDVHNENGGQQHNNSKHSQHGGYDKKNSSDNPSKSHTSNEQYNEIKNVKKIFSEDENTGGNVECNEKYYHEDQRVNFKEPSKQQSPNSSRCHGLVTSEIASIPIVKDENYTSQYLLSENAPHKHDCSSSDNYSRDGSKNLSNAFIAAHVSEIIKTGNHVKNNDSHSKGGYSNQRHGSSQMGPDLEHEMAYLEKDKETIKNQLENVDIVFKNCGSISDDNISRPVPAPRHLKSDGNLFLNSNSNTLGPNSPTGINPAPNEKGDVAKCAKPVMKAGSLNQVKNNVEGAIGFGSKPESFSNELLLLMCVDCAKLIPQKICEGHVNKGHKVMIMDEGIEILINKELKTFRSMENDIQNKCLEIHRHDTIIDASINVWSDLFKAFKEWQLHPGSQEENGNQILYQIQEMTGKIVSMDRPNSIMNFENLRLSAQKTKIQVETWHGETNKMIPFWLLSAWLKNTLAIILSGAISQGKDIFVVNGKQGEQIAKLLFLGNRLFLSPYLKNVTTKDDGYFIKHELVGPVFDKETSLAFMRISCGNEELSEPIIIRVNTATFWGKQFLFMCTSESGQSFLGTKFFRNNWIGKEGHHIWGGDYSNNDGSGGKVVLPDKDMSLEKSPLPVVEGMLASRFGYEDRSTIFRIYLQGSRSEFIENSAFAQIEEGIDILQYAAMKGDITQVTISDIGLVAELN